MTSRSQNAWIIGPLPDLLLGSGLLYLLVITGLIIGGSDAREGIPSSWGSYLILIVSGSHYGATLLRVYDRRAERRTYRVFAVYGTAVMLAMLIGALYSPLAGSLLITLYLSWSPWHYTGQNYGIAMMFLRRRGVEVTTATKRWLYVSFVFSFLSVLLNFHFEGGVSQGNPLGYATLDSSSFHFISLGLPGEIRSILLPLVGLGYLTSIITALTLLLRSGSLRAIAPTALVMVTQAVWFSIPHMGFYFDLGSRIPAFDPIGGDNFRFYFLWIAVGHAAQYLWITTHYAKTSERWRGTRRYLTKAFVFGNAVWAAPVMLLGPELFGRPDYETGLAMCVAAAVNLHHFVLDGAIWKLRNPKIAAVLFGNRRELASADSAPASLPWSRRAAWTIAGFFFIANVIPKFEIEQRLPAALRNKDYAAAESILDRAALYGRDSSIWRALLAGRLVNTSDPRRAIHHYRRSLKLYPRSSDCARLGVLVEKLEGLEAAITIWEDGLDQFPDDFDLNLHLGSGLMRIGRGREAIPFLERAVDLRPGDESAATALAAGRLSAVQFE